ncbi:MAG: PTS sugar transporter subunit IIC [Gemmatimonadaceae bacterium]
MIELPTLAGITLLGAVLGLDMVSFPQAMLSRPIVGSTLAGALCGNTAAGLVVGVLLECFALETMPFGASRYPEWGPASVAAGVLAAVPAVGDATGRIAPFAVLAGLAAAMLAGRTLVWLRQFNALEAARHRDAIAAGDAAAIVGLQWTGIIVDFGRAGAVTALLVVLLVPVRNMVLAQSGASGASAVLFATVVAVGVGGGAFWKVVHNTRGYGWWMLAGLLAGLGVMVLR